MGMIRKALAGVAAGASITAGLTVVNIVQAGNRNPDGRTMGEILGVDPEEATFSDIEKLSRADTMQLFYAALTPPLDAIRGEYRAELLSGGVLGGATALFTHYVFPTGTLTLDTRWHGKAFQPEGPEGGWGINAFSGRDHSGAHEPFYTRKMRIYTAPTIIGRDGRDSIHLDYTPYNHDIVKSMHDEIRQINRNLFLGAGYMSLTGGPMNPAPFVLTGPPVDFPQISKP